MDRNAILAVMISLGIWVGWQRLYLDPLQQEAAKEKQRLELVQKEKAKKAVEEAKVALQPAAKGATRLVSAERRTIENEQSVVTVSNEPNGLYSWELKKFFTNEEAHGQIALVGATGFNSQLGLRLSDNQMSELSVKNWEFVASQDPKKAVSRYSQNGFSVTRTFTLDETGYGANLEYQFQFQSEPPKYIFLDSYGSLQRPNDKEGSIFGQAPDKVHVSYRDLSGRHTEIAAKLKEPKESAAGLKWVGLDTRYFVFALVPQGEEKDSAGVQLAKDESREQAAVRASLVYPSEGKKQFTLSARVYFGPKEMASLQAVSPVLTDTIDFGWTSFIAVPLLQGLKWLYSYVRNYGLAIILLTFMIKMILFPLTYKSMKSMAKIAKLQPQLNALREKYKEDKEKLNVEMMNFMKTNGYNPIGGCLPIVLQMPIFFALYRVLFNSMELYQAPFAGWIHDLSSPDPFFVTPVLLCGLMFLQQKLSPNTASDPVQQKMMQFMPVMFGMFMLLLPAGLNIYMVVNSATSIAQQWVLNRKLGIKPNAVTAGT